MVASAEEVVFALTMLPLVLMVGLGLFRVDWVAVTTPPATGDVDWKTFIQIMFWTSTYWQKVHLAALALEMVDALYGYSTDWWMLVIAATFSICSTVAVV